MLLAAALALGACADEAPPSTGNAELDQSFAAWREIRDDAGGDYIYSRGLFGPTDAPYTLTFTIENNQVVSRKSDEGWVESGAELGSHGNEANIRTFDELYDECVTDYLNPGPAQSEYPVTLAFFDNGLLRTCNFDGFLWTGVRVLSFETTPS